MVRWQGLQWSTTSEQIASANHPFGNKGLWTVWRCYRVPTCSSHRFLVLTIAVFFIRKDGSYLLSTVAPVPNHQVNFLCHPAFAQRFWSLGKQMFHTSGVRWRMCRNWNKTLAYWLVRFLSKQTSTDLILLGDTLNLEKNHGLSRCLTHVEVAGGTHFVEQTLSVCKPATMSTTFLIDLHCYDGWPALAVLQDSWVWDTVEKKLEELPKNGF